ncbi:MoaD/ThiS family protein [Gaetbulibacter aestuarii]|uniref:MoaD/ThiS family protein n=1 Tax=Gaetbulibacter aestuarii TaxID=1502358 RepID=A0ABW7N2W9_9FLAO
MVITIKFFGQITEITECTEETLDVSGSLIYDLVEELYGIYPQLADISFKVAQDQELVPLETPLNGSEIALLPPFAGG